MLLRATPDPSYRYDPLRLRFDTLYYPGMNRAGNQRSVDRVRHYLVRPLDITANSVWFGSIATRATTGTRPSLTVVLSKNYLSAIFSMIGRA